MEELNYTFKDLVKVVPKDETQDENYIVIGNRIASPKTYSKEYAKKIVNGIQWDIMATFVTMLFDAYTKKMMENHTDDMENRTEEEKEKV